LFVIYVVDMVHNTIPTHPYLLFQLDGAVWWGGGKGGVLVVFFLLWVGVVS